MVPKSGNKALNAYFCFLDYCMLIEMARASKYNMVHNLLNMYIKHLVLSWPGANDVLLATIALALRGYTSSIKYTC